MRSSSSKTETAPISMRWKARPTALLILISSSCALWRLLAASRIPLQGSVGNDRPAPPRGGAVRDAPQLRSRPKGAPNRTGGRRRRDQSAVDDQQYRRRAGDVGAAQDRPLVRAAGRPQGG